MDLTILRLKLLYKAAYAGDVKSLKELVKEDNSLLERVSTTTRVNDNPLHIAAFLDHDGFAKEIIQLKSTLAHELDDQGMSPLHVAAAQGHYRVATVLVQVDSNLCLLPAKDGYLPVHIAVIKGKQEIITLLIEKCNDCVNYKLTDNLETILHLAVKEKRSEIVELLTAQPIITQHILNSKDCNGNTILHLAFASRQKKVIKHILKLKGIDLNSKNSAGLTPLDVLLCTNQEKGDLHLGELLRAAGGKTTKELGASEIHMVNLSPNDPGNTSNPPGNSQTNNVNPSLVLLDPDNTSDPPGNSQTNSVNHSPVRDPGTADPPGNSQINSVNHSPVRDPSTADLPGNSQADNGNHSPTPEDETYKNIENNLIVVATLVATITYVAALNPPGGAIQMPFDNSNRNDTNWLNKWKIMDTIYPAGSPVYMWQLRKFFKYDYTALYASVSVILLSLPGVIGKNVIMRKLLVLVLWSSVFCMVMAFNSALSILLYTDRNKSEFSWTAKGFIVWVTFFVFVTIPLFMDIIVSIVKIVRTWLWPNDMPCPSTLPTWDRIKEITPYFIKVPIGLFVVGWIVALIYLVVTSELL